MQDEYNSDSDIYTRLYFDYCKNEIYIPGYIVKDDFFRKPHLSRMPGSKSGKAIYYMHSISAHTSFFDLDKDERMWNYDRMIAYKQLFAGKKRGCPNCNGKLSICKGEARKQYFYRCYDCSKNYSVDEIIK